MSVRKESKDGNIFEKALQEYIRLLQVRPVVTKAVTRQADDASLLLLYELTFSLLSHI
jgi:hypothetical protein